jgi:protein ImuB
MYAGIYIPDLPLEAIMRHEPALRSRATAIVEGTPPLCTVIAVNRIARETGVAPGMTKLEARQFSALEIRHRSPAEEASAQAALLDLGLSISPRVEAAAAGTVVLDLAGLEHLFGPPEIMTQRLARSARELELEVNVAVASNPAAAIHAARGFCGVTVIPAGEEMTRLGSLPVSVLAPPAEILETLDRWGVRTLKALATLPTVALSERLGQEGVHLQKLARGHTHRTLVPVEAAPRFEEVMELDDPVTLLEPFAFILGRLLNQLCARLKARSLATQELRLILEFEPGIDAELETRPGLAGPIPNSAFRTLRLPVPTQDAQLLLKLWLLNLKSDPPQAPILKVALAAEPVKPRVAQGGLFLPLAPDPEKLEVTLERIRGVVGIERVGSPELVDTHRPDAFRMRWFNPGARSQELEPGPRPAMALRIFRPPLPATVEVRAGRPARIFAFGVRGDVVAASGPWRTSGDWWRDDPWSHDEWDIELASGVSAQRSAIGYEPQQTPNGAPRTRLYRIYRDLSTGNWFVRGSYD